MPAGAPILRQDVQAELDRVKLSPEFRQSEQCKRLLTYLVEQSISGAPDLLKERAIGVALFGLIPGYDTNENPIVRVRANDIRKRLARFYQENSNTTLRLDVPPGAYRVEFRHCAPSPALAVANADPAPVAQQTSAPTPAERASRSRFPLQAAGIFLAAAAALGGLAWNFNQPGQLERFWAPAFDRPIRTVIYVAQPDLPPLGAQGGHSAHAASRDAERRSSGDEPLGTAGPLLRPAAWASTTDHYVDSGTTAAVAQIYGWLARHNEPTDIRFEHSAPVNDLQHSPVVMIGSFGDPWSLAQTSRLRFSIEMIQGNRAVRDRRSGQMWPLSMTGRDGQPAEDYFVISRTVHPETGQLVIGVTAITPAGISAAAELLTDPEAFPQVLGSSAPDGRHANFQAVCRVRITGQPTSKPILLASSTW